MNSRWKKTGPASVGKTYVSQEEFEFFRYWLLTTQRVEPLPVSNPFELLRWKNAKEGRPMPICFRRIRTDRVTLNGEAAREYKRYLRETAV